MFADAMVASTSMFNDDIELSLLLGGVQRLTPEAFKLMSPRDVIEVYEARHSATCVSRKLTKKSTLFRQY